MILQDFQAVVKRHPVRSRYTAAGEVGRLIDACLAREDRHSRHLHAAQAVRAELEALALHYESRADRYQSLARAKRRQAYVLLDEAARLETVEGGQL